MVLIATAAFGVEAALKREIARMGRPVRKVANGRVFFDGDDAVLAAANMRLRCADRVLLCLGEFRAETFEELFTAVNSIRWEDMLPEDAKINVAAKSVKSALFSVPDIQSITKKAIIERLKTKYSREWFPEGGAAFAVEAAILENEAVITLDASGAGLHKRGYRVNAGAAPIKETLAAAMLDYSFWKPGRPLIDPFCGSGTFLIEAAMIHLNMAAGQRREFASEKWGFIDKSAYRAERAKAFAEIKRANGVLFYGYDKDEAILETARRNAEAAGVAEAVSFSRADITEYEGAGKGGGIYKPENAVVISNPPYGSRVGEPAEIRKTYKPLRRLAADSPLYIITSDTEFERIYAKKADAKRKLFNGGAEAVFYQYHGAKPGKPKA